VRAVVYLDLVQRMMASLTGEKRPIGSMEIQTATSWWTAPMLELPVCAEDGPYA
jgi:hypothetical protein